MKKAKNAAGWILLIFLLVMVVPTVTGFNPMKSLLGSVSGITLSPFVGTWKAGEGLLGGITLVLNKDGHGVISILGQAGQISWTASGRDVEITYPEGNKERGQLADDGKSFTLNTRSGPTLYLKQK